MDVRVYISKDACNSGYVRVVRSALLASKDDGFHRASLRPSSFDSADACISSDLYANLAAYRAPFARQFNSLANRHLPIRVMVRDSEQRVAIASRPFILDPVVGLLSF